MKHEMYKSLPTGPSRKLNEFNPYLSNVYGLAVTTAVN